MAAFAWIRRLIVSIGIGTTSYALMLGIMVLSVVYDRELEPVITYAFDLGRSIVAAFDWLVSGSHWGQVAINHLRERVNMTHVVLSIPAIVIATIIVGIPFNRLLGGTRTALQRIAIALVSIPATVVLAVVLVHVQRADASGLCGAAALCRLGLAGLAQCAERFRRQPAGSAKAHQCRSARLLRASLRDYGVVQHAGFLPGQCRFRVILEVPFRTISHWHGRHRREPV